MPPIFIGITRSFWLTVVTVALFLAEGPNSVQAVIDLLDTMLPPATVDLVAEWLFKFGPVLTMVAAIWQRSHAARPYSLNPKHR